MINSPYQTLACSGYDPAEIIMAAEKEMILDPYASMVPFENNIGGQVMGLFSNARFNPVAFAHPIDLKVRDAKIHVVDVRPFTKISKLELFGITKHTDYELARRRGTLHAIWNSNDAFLIQNTAVSLMPVFSAWISESIARHLSIEGFEQLKIANLAAWWYYCQCNENAELDSVKKAKLYRLVSEANRCTVEAVEEDLKDVPYFDSVLTFVDVVGEQVGSPRVKHLDSGVLLQLCSGGWIGTWSREIMAACTEYPPYFTAVVYTALHDRGTRSSQFAKFVQRFATRPEMRAFKTSIERLSN